MSSPSDFDFFFGNWTVRNRYLGERLRGSEDWQEFEATSEARPLPGVLGNEDEFRTEALGGFVGMSFRFFDPEAKRWSIYWADSRRPGVLDPPVFGAFANGSGVFEGTDVLAGKPHPALLRRIEAGDQIEQRGLAGAVRTDDREHQARRHRQAHVVDRVHAAEGDRQVLGGEDAHGRLAANAVAMVGTMPARRKIITPMTMRPSTMCS